MCVPGWTHSDLRMGSDAEVTVQMMSALATACSTVAWAVMGRAVSACSFSASAVCAFGGAAPDGDGFEGADFADGAGVGGGLLAGAEDGEVLRVLAGERIGGDGARRSGADGGDLAGVDDADGCAGLGLEEDDEALVRLAALRGVLRKDADQFCAEWFRRAKRAGHDAEEVSVGERDDGAEELFCFAGGEGDHRIAHERDADVVGEAAGYFFAVDEAHTGIVVVAMRSQ